MKKRTPGKPRIFFTGFAALLFFLWAAVFPRPLHGQALDSEIRELEGRPGSSSAGRRLARLNALAGNIERAAENWAGAAYANPESTDYTCLLEAARCHITLGDYPAADRAIQIVQNSVTAPPLLREAQYLAALSASLRSGDGTALAALLPVPEYGDKKSAILYMLWQITGEESFRARLRTEHPASPEGAILSGNPRGVTISARPLWFFSPGRERLALGSPAIPPQNAGEAPENAENRPGPVLLQAGLFSQEENARLLADRLRQAGFRPSITRREVNGSVFYVVGVDPGGLPGEPPNAMILRLKDASFQAFPVY